MFPSLKGFDFGLDYEPRADPGNRAKFPSLKGFDFGLDPGQRMTALLNAIGFHPSKGSTSAWIGGS